MAYKKKKYTPWSERSSWSKRRYIATKRAKSTTSGIGVLALLAVGYFILKDWKGVGSVGDGGFGSGDIQINLPGEKSVGDAVSDLFGGSSGSGISLSPPDLAFGLGQKIRGIPTALTRGAVYTGYLQDRVGAGIMNTPDYISSLPPGLNFQVPGFRMGYAIGELFNLNRGKPSVIPIATGSIRNDYNAAWVAGKDAAVSKVLGSSSGRKKSSSSIVQRETVFHDDGTKTFGTLHPDIEL